jgi:translation initiation factor 1
VTDRPFHNPFGVLAPLRGREPAAPASPQPVAPEPAPPPAGSASLPRAVVRLQRKGRGGKDVTLIEHLDLPAADRETWLKALKSALGCGGQIDDGALVLQGDQRARLPALLRARGVRKVIVS